VRVLCPRCDTIIRWEENPYRPFCSQRCKLIDLGTWADEAYRIAGEKPSDSDKEEREGGA